MLLGLLNFNMFIGLLFNSVTAQSKCFAITDTKACPEYKDYMVKMPNLDFYRDSASFDKYILSNGIFNMGPNVCQKWPQVGTEPISYSVSFACGYIINESMKECNQGKTLDKPLCKSTIDTALGYLDQTLTSKQCDKEKFKTAFGSYLSYQNAAPSQNCIRNLGGSNGDVAKVCGFSGNDAGNVAKAFCDSKQGKPACCDPKSPNIINDSAAATSASSSPTLSPDSSSGSSTASPEATTSNNAQQKTETSSQPAINPVFISAGAFGVAFLLILGCALFLMNKRKDPVTSASKGYAGEKGLNAPAMAAAAAPAAAALQAQENEMEVIFEYNATLFDEVTLNLGDRVLVHEEFDDGWAMGVNLSTEKDGTFPLACLGPIGSYDPNSSSNIETTTSFSGYNDQGSRLSQYSKRSSSMTEAKSKYQSSQYQPMPDDRSSHYTYDTKSQYTMDESKYDSIYSKSDYSVFQPKYPSELPPSKKFK